jgi:hypothetical protein
MLLLAKRRYAQILMSTRSVKNFFGALGRQGTIYILVGLRVLPMACSNAEKHSPVKNEVYECISDYCILLLQYQYR